MTTAEFYKACKGTDWFYQFSDDQSVYAHGRDECLRRAGELDTPEKNEIYLAFHTECCLARHEGRMVEYPTAESFGISEADLEA